MSVFSYLNFKISLLVLNRPGPEIEIGIENFTGKNNTEQYSYINYPGSHQNRDVFLYLH